MTLHLTPRPFIVVVTAFFCVAAMPAARAQDASAWETQPHAAARLIAGAATKSASANQLQAGIEIKLAPGWHTYWRYPGDSGVPPTFDFAGSQNIRSVSVLWPAPQRFADGAGGHSIGYIGEVVLPLRIVPDDPGKPASLHVKLGYAICGNMCIPGEADLALTVSGQAGAQAAAVAAADKRVPRRVPLGALGALAILAVHREAGGTHERVIVDIAAPKDAAVDLFAEGPTPEWALPLPEPAAAGGSAPGVRRFAFALDGLPQGARAKGAKLMLTAVSPNDAIEVAAPLD